MEVAPVVATVIVTVPEPAHVAAGVAGCVVIDGRTFEVTEAVAVLVELTQPVAAFFDSA